MFSPSEIYALRGRISKNMSKKRFLHTLGVEAMAVKLAQYCLPEDVAEISAAALLHDVAKEIPCDELLRIIENGGIVLDEAERKMPAVWHSLAAPFVIKRDFPEFATDKVLSSVYNHTLGAPDMSVFDEIIFVSDFIEETRAYAASRITREKLLGSLTEGNFSSNISALHVAVLDEMDSTLAHLSDKGVPISERTILTRNAFLTKI